MTAPIINSGAGLKHVRYYVLNNNGIPDGDQNGTIGYDGVRVTGVQSFTPNFPDVRFITHVGDDRPFALDYLPPDTLATATLTTGKTNLEADAELTNTKVATVGETKLAPLMTDKQGTEIDVCLVVWRQAQDTDPGSATAGVRTWVGYLGSKSRLIPKASPADQGAADVNNYNVAPTVVTTLPWGEDLNESEHGCNEAQMFRFSGNNPPMMMRWTGNATIDTFSTYPWKIINADKTAVYVNGVAATVNSVDDNNDTFTLSSAPGHNAEVVAWFETASAIS